MNSLNLGTFLSPQNNENKSIGLTLPLRF